MQNVPCSQYQSIFNEQVCNRSIYKVALDVAHKRIYERIVFYLEEYF